MYKYIYIYIYMCVCVYNQVDGSRPRQKQRKSEEVGNNRTKNVSLRNRDKKRKNSQIFEKCEAMLVANKERIWEIHLIF